MDSGRANLWQAIIQFWMHAPGAFDLNHVIDCGEVLEAIEGYDSCGDFVSFRRMLHEGVAFEPDGREVVHTAGEFHNDTYSLSTGNTCLEGSCYTILRLATHCT